MNQTHPEAPAKHTPTDINAAPRKGRRKLIQAGIAGAPVLLALKSTPVLAGNCKHPSGFSVSGNLSATGGKNCSSPFPGPTDWIKNPSTWPSGITPDTVFKTALGANALGQADTFTLGEALGDTANPLNAKAAAVFLGSFSYGPPGPAVIKALWTDGVQGGGYASLGYTNESTTWHQTEVAKYFDYLLGLIF